MSLHLQGGANSASASSSLFLKQIFKRLRSFDNSLHTLTKYEIAMLLFVLKN